MLWAVMGFGVREQGNRNSGVQARVQAIRLGSSGFRVFSLRVQGF